MSLVHGVDAHFACDPPPSKDTDSFGFGSMIRLVGPSGQQFRSKGLLCLAGHDLIGDHSLISIHRHMLHGNLLLPSAGTGASFWSFAERGFGPNGTNTRVMLGLPPRSYSPDNGKNRGARG